MHSKIKFLKWALPSCIFAFLCLFVGVIYILVSKSLSIHVGEVSIEQLTKEVEIFRDKRGIPTIAAENRKDIALALGFLHAQERFFQMDVMRRAAAGELSELFGDVSLQFDKERRFHRLRKVAQATWTQLTDKEKDLLQAYTYGVNNGLGSLQAKPIEYYLLNSEASPWKPEDSLLVGLGLFFELQDSKGHVDITRGVMQRLLPERVYRFFMENGSVWDASLDKSRIQMIDIPPAADFEYLKSHSTIKAAYSKNAPENMKGSNQWAVSGSLTKDGRALLACDMHLNLAVPNIWYRATFHYNDENHEATEVHGATLPGTPLMAVGSNRHIAWGFTNAYIDTTDVFIISETDKKTEITQEMEWINVKGSAAVPYEISISPHGPLLVNKYFNSSLALRWIAHDSLALNMRLTDLETTRSAFDALQVSRRIRVPIFNFLVADVNGHIGWTLIGALPERQGFDGKTPIRTNRKFMHWSGFVDPSTYPVIYDPPEGIIVTANNRTLGNAWTKLIGNNGFLNGMRAFQITKRLKENKLYNEAEMLNIQLDDEAIFFNRWKDLLLGLLTDMKKRNAHQEELLDLLNEWDGFCTIDSSAYYWIRSFRDKVSKKVLDRLFQPCIQAYNHIDLSTFDLEEPLWLIVYQKPDYLVSPDFESWEVELSAYLKEVLEEVPFNKSISEQTWGKRNKLAINHPLGDAIPLIGRLLNMPNDQVSGDFWVPHVSGPNVGASQRLVVSPGSEEKGIFVAPGGQNGHPLSRNYSDCHHSWVDGKADSLLPEETISKLVLQKKP